MIASEKWQIRSRGKECFILQRPFTDGEEIITALFDDIENGGYMRRDFSLEGWKGFEAEKKGVFSFWKSRYFKVVVEEKSSHVMKESPEDCLKRLVMEDEPHTENSRYILAVILERQKKLTETSSQLLAEGILRIYEQRKTGEVFIIKDPNIPLSKIESVQQEVMMMFTSNTEGREA
jgi:hypothetical protein